MIFGIENLNTRMCSMKTLIQLPVVALIFAITAAAQNQQSSTAKSQPVKAESVTINMPEGITRDQADEILKELKAIHQLLERQQTAAVQPPAAPTSDKVKMSVGAGWYSMGREDAPVTVV